MFSSSSRLSLSTCCGAWGGGHQRYGVPAVATFISQSLLPPSVVPELWVPLQEAQRFMSFPEKPQKAISEPSCRLALPKGSVQVRSGPLVTCSSLIPSPSYSSHVSLLPFPPVPLFLPLLSLSPSFFSPFPPFNKSMLLSTYCVLPALTPSCGKHPLNTFTIKHMITNLDKCPCGKVPTHFTKEGAEAQPPQPPRVREGLELSCPPSLSSTGAPGGELQTSRAGPAPARMGLFSGS